jgi:hypothetical protein
MVKPTLREGIIGVLLILSVLTFIVSTLQIAPDTVTESQCTQCTLSKCNKANTFFGISYFFMAVVLCYIIITDVKRK